MGDRGFQLSVDKDRVTFTGDVTKELTASLHITNKSDSRQAYKVKCTRNDLFRIRPPSGILDFGATVEIVMQYKPIPNYEPESEKHHLGIYHIPAPEGSTSAGAWAEHYGPPQGEKRFKIYFEKS
uniref:Major sperm protein n=1 Tax=Panagrellus redivivus TaxID=6233 RepID=A0A7E4V0U2_PANRE